MLTVHNPTIAAPTTLERLQDYLRVGTLWDGAPLKHGELDTTSLPTFGGPEPADTQGVWSWDEERLLVGTCPSDVMLEWRTEPEATDDDILELQIAAVEDGDGETADMTVDALGGDAKARAMCEELVFARRAKKARQ